MPLEDGPPLSSLFDYKPIDRVMEPTPTDQVPHIPEQDDEISSSVVVVDSQTTSEQYRRTFWAVRLIFLAVSLVLALAMFFILLYLFQRKQQQAVQR